MSLSKSQAVAAVAMILAVAALGAFGPRDLATTPSAAQTEGGLHAAGNNLLEDLDGDLVPHCVELLAHTDPGHPDADRDGIDDFEEILTFTSQDRNLAARPVDYAMRAIVTSTQTPGGETKVYLHLLMRFVNLKASEVEIHDLYLHRDGYPQEVSLVQFLGHGDVTVRSRSRARDGVSYMVSAEVGSIELIKQLLPCTIGVRAALGGKTIDAGTYLLLDGTSVWSVLPFENKCLIMQPVDAASYVQDSEPYYNGKGRVCEMALTEIGTGLGGTLCEVTSAKCRVAAGLRCSATCPNKKGTTVTIPGGIGTITGQ